ncbi:MAG: peptidylprolyl isomerase [Methylacidiphilales bacterium]|nr:peptidylprolyl isomerase [Candidatus Methylacidiphilales bacterium]
MAILACGALTLAGCHRAVTDPKDPKFIVAEKPGQWQITRGELDKEINAFLQEKSVTPDQVGPDRMLLLQTGLLDNMVKTKLILAQAATLQFPDLDQETEKQLQAFKDQLPPGTDFNAKMKELGVTLDDVKKNVRDHVLIEKVLKTEALKNDEPTDQQVDDYYLQHKDQFVIPPKVRASRIVIMVDPTTPPEAKAAKKKAIDAAYARVMKGEDFAKVAAQVSEDRYSSTQGGDIGFFSQGQNEAGFDDEAFHTKLNEVSPVFETAMGYEFLKVTDQHPSTQLSEAEAHSIIANGLRQLTDRQEVAAYTQKLLDNGGVVFHVTRVDPNQLPPPSSAPADGASAPQTQGATTPPSQ